MAREQVRGENKTEKSKARQAGANSTNGNGSSKTDRERSIETQRENGGPATATSGRSGGLTRTSSSSPVYSPGAYASPFSLVSRLAEDMDRLFEDFTLGRGLGGLSQFDRDFGRLANLQSTWTPQVETFRRGDNIVVRADLPGLRKEDINVEVGDGVLTISGERGDENEERRDGYYHSERSYGRFYRSLALPDGADPDSVEATFKDGVLEVTVKAPEGNSENRKRVQIR